jgi:hypothetical protein
MKKFIKNHLSAFIIVAYITLASAAVITQINESQVKNLVSDLSGKQATLTLSSTPSANMPAVWDVNSNMSANAVLQGYTTTASAVGTTTLTVSSNRWQFCTGTLTQTFRLPVVSTLNNGEDYYIVNGPGNGIITVQSSGANNLTPTLTGGMTMHVVCISTSGTGTASWQVVSISANTSTGTGNAVFSSNPAFAGTVGGTVAFSGKITFNQANTYKTSPTAINTTSTITTTQLATGTLTSTSAAAVTMTLPTATAIGYPAGTTFIFTIDNTAGANTVTIVLGSGMTLLNSGSLTIPSGSTGVSQFDLYFSTSTACTIARIY